MAIERRTDYRVHSRTRSSAADASLAGAFSFAALEPRCLLACVGSTRAAQPEWLDAFMLEAGEQVRYA
jgi:hypothetical protein